MLNYKFEGSNKTYIFTSRITIIVNSNEQKSGSEQVNK
jgi:hypothetical protein